MYKLIYKRTDYTVITHIDVKYSVYGDQTVISHCIVHDHTLNHVIII